MIRTMRLPEPFFVGQCFVPVIIAFVYLLTQLRVAGQSPR